MPRGRRRRGWRWSRESGGPGRPFREIHIEEIPHARQFQPVPMGNPKPMDIAYPEYEAFRLADFEGLTQEQAAERMKTSRGTVWRLLKAARRKVAKALVESRPIIIEPKGEVEKV